MRVAALIAAGGKGLRMGSERIKQLLPIGDIPALVRSVMVFDGHPGIETIIVVAPPGGLKEIKTTLEPWDLRKISAVVEGGRERQDSVRAGLTAVPPGITRVAVHDGARPLLPYGVLDRALNEAVEHPAVVVAVRVKDTIKVSDGQGFVLATPSRHDLWAAQTPQIFETGLLSRAYQKAAGDGYLGTDDASLVERLGTRVRLVEGSEDNLKITTPTDILLAELILKRAAPHSSGIKRE